MRAIIIDNKDASYCIMRDEVERLRPRLRDAEREREEAVRLLERVRSHGMPRGTTYDFQQEIDAFLDKVER